MTLSPAERIAVFMGWHRPTTIKDEFLRGHVFSDGLRYVADVPFPRLDSYDYLRTVEDELARRGMFDNCPSRPSYSRELRRAVANDDWSDFKIGCLATAAQRVEAILRVIEEMGGGK